MTDSPPPAAPVRRGRTDLAFYLGLAAVVLFFVAAGAVSYVNTRALQQSAREVAHTHEVLLALSDVLSLMKDAETGQRGFILTGDEKYLAPYTAALAAVDTRVADLERLTAGNADQQARIPALKDNLDAKRRELAETIAIRRTMGFEAARVAVASDRGKIAMDALRQRIEAMQRIEEALRARRLAERETAFRVAVLGGFVTGLVGILLAAVAA